MENKRVFISYSWDSEEHQEWVLYLANQLRKKGLNAEVDIFETQVNSTNLNRMMVDKVRDSDRIIVVLTENYARKADSFDGGVGFESQLTLPFIMENPNKLILIMRHQGDYKKVFPFHFKGQHAIDFSDDVNYEKKLEELIYKIYGRPRYHVEPVGEVPTLKPKIPGYNTNHQLFSSGIKSEPSNDYFSDINIPSLKRITDRDIEKFLKKSYQEIVDLFDLLFKQIQKKSPEFEYDRDDINNFKSMFSIYVDGNLVSGIKIWFGGGLFGRNTINLSYGKHINASDNSMNQVISHEIDSENDLKLKMTMNMFSGGQDATTPEEIVKVIWEVT